MTKYLQVVAWVKEQIAEGHLRYGDKVHTENGLCEMFSVSRQTVRQALGLLESEGYIERRQGSGTYVCYREPEAPVRNMNVGVISTYIDDYIFPGIIRGIESVLRKSGYAMQVVFTYNRVENERQALLGFMDKPLDGLIVEPSKSGLPNPNVPLYRKLREKGMPIVFFDSFYPDIDIPHVSLDDRAAGYTATKHLISMGHERIAGIFQCDDIQGPLRYAGYMDALLESGLSVDAKRTAWFATEDIPILLRDGDRILQRLEDCTAVLCYNDNIASMLMPFLASHGIRVPEALSVIGIDNSTQAQHTEPPLTSVNHPKERLGEIAAENLIRLISDPGFDATVDFPPALVERESVGRRGEERRVSAPNPA